MSKPFIILLSDGPAARLVLQKTAAILAEFPEIQVRNVNNPGAAVSKLGGVLSRRPFVGILATSKPGGVANFAKRCGTNALVVVPVATRAAAGLRLLRAATAAGAPTVALGEAGARNAALLAVSIFAANGAFSLGKALDDFRARQTASVLDTRLPAV